MRRCTFSIWTAVKNVKLKASPSDKQIEPKVVNNIHDSPIMIIILIKKYKPYTNRKKVAVF